MIHRTYFYTTIINHSLEIDQILEKLPLATYLINGKNILKL